MKLNENLSRCGGYVECANVVLVGTLFIRILKKGKKIYKNQ